MIAGASSGEDRSASIRPAPAADVSPASSAALARWNSAVGLEVPGIGRERGVCAWSSQRPGPSSNAAGSAGSSGT